MAGMLPGVECARRRRFHQAGDYPAPGSSGWTRRSSFCLHTGSNERAFSLHTSLLNYGYEDEKLGDVAREAKGRLDERLRSQTKSETRRHKNHGGGLRRVNGRPTAAGELQTEVFATKKNGSKRFNWAKLSWKSAEQDECTICLDHFHAGDALVHLPCAHRYHPRCLVPWLEKNAHCPCCRMEIHVELS